MGNAEPDNVVIIQMHIHTTDPSNFVILGLGSDSDIYVFNKEVGWEKFKSS